MQEGIFAEAIRIHGHGGEQVGGYLARPAETAPQGSVVVIHHAPGYDEATKEIVRKFATHGYAALCVDLHYREDPLDPAKAAAAVREAGGVPDDRLIGDVEGAIRYLRLLPSSNGKVGVIGYCSGGRQTYLAACRIPSLDAAVVCYGGGVVAPPERLSPRQPVAPIDLTPDLACPLLGLFGAEDRNPSPEDVARTEQELKRLGKTYEFHTYENAGHSFFSVDRPAYRQQAAVEGWVQVFSWFERYLGV